MDKIDLDKNFSPQTVLMDTQKAVPTTGPTNFCRNDRQKSLNAKWWKKETFQKKFFQKPSWTRGKQLWQFCRLFLDEKKTVASLFVFGRTWKKHKQKLRPNKVMSSKWSFGLVECSFVKLNGKFSKTVDKFPLNVQKCWRKTFLTEVFFYHKLLQWTDTKQFWRHRTEFFAGMPEKNLLKCQWRAKKEPFRTKSSSKDLLEKS